MLTKNTKQIRTFQLAKKNSNIYQHAHKNKVQLFRPKEKKYTKKLPRAWRAKNKHTGTFRIGEYLDKIQLHIL